MALDINNMTYDQLLAAVKNFDSSGADGPERARLWQELIGDTGLSFAGNYSGNGDPILQLHNPQSDLADEGYKGRGSGWGLSRGADGGIAKTRYEYGPSRPDPAMLAVLAAPFAVSALQGAGVLGGAGEAAATSGASGALGTGAAGAGEVAGGGMLLDTAGMGMTGAGGIGAASSVTGAGAGAAGYGAAAAGGGMLNALSGFLGNPITQVGASLLNGYMGSRAADKAADAQTAASGAAIAEQRRQYDQTRTDLAPWRDRGGNAANRLSVMMGLSGNAQDPNFNKGYQAAPRYAPGASMNALQRFMRPLNRG